MCMTFRPDGRSVPLTAATAPMVAPLPDLGGPGTERAGDCRPQGDSAPAAVTAGPHDLGVMGVFLPELDAGTAPDGGGVTRTAFERLARGLAVGFAVFSIAVAAFLVVFTWWILVMQPGPVIARQGAVTMPVFLDPAPSPPADSRRAS